MTTRLTRDEWAAAVADVIAEHPEWTAATVEAIQAGALEALARQLDRVSDLSMGLVEALNTKPGHVKRDHDAVIRAIKASTAYPTAWSAAAIAKEQP